MLLFGFYLKVSSSHSSIGKIPETTVLFFEFQPPNKKLSQFWSLRVTIYTCPDLSTSTARSCMVGSGNKAKIFKDQGLDVFFFSLRFEYFLVQALTSCSCKKSYLWLEFLKLDLAWATTLQKFHPYVKTKKSQLYYPLPNKRTGTIWKKLLRTGGGLAWVRSKKLSEISVGTFIRVGTIFEFFIAA